MIRIRTVATWLLVGLALAATAGCSTAIKQGYYTATGASARYYELEEVGGDQALLDYHTVEVQPFGAMEFYGKLPGGLADTVQTAIQKKVTEIDNVTGEPKALRIEGTFVDYDPGGSPARVVGLGGNPFLTARIRLIGDGQTLGIAMVTGTVKSAVRTGAGELADGVGKGVKSLLEAHMKKSD